MQRIYGCRPSTHCDIYFYVYRITQISSGKHYYGKRSSDLVPHLDLGIRYHSSSVDREFRNDQERFPLDFKYKVVRILKSSREALDFERHLWYSIRCIEIC